MANAQVMHSDNKMGPFRIAAAIIIGILLLVIAVMLYTKHHQAETSPHSTQQTNPNTTQNVPPTGQVNQGSNPSNDTTASPNGTNGNPMSSQ
jgi:cytoskeletal protein RodZ